MWVVKVEDLNLVFHVMLTFFVVGTGLFYLARKSFKVDAGFDHQRDFTPFPTNLAVDGQDPCAVCSSRPSGVNKRSLCESVRYRSLDRQESRWQAVHEAECWKPKAVNLDLASRPKVRFTYASVAPLVPQHGVSKILQKPGKILFPYDEFVTLFNWNNPGFLPCGLLNCGNSCFANAVIQCLVSTRPLVAFLLEKGHKRECRRYDWCFFCEFQTLTERVSESSHPFSPINIVSQLPNIGGSLGYGTQEDAHEFMRFAIDTMQSICLDEFGGERVVPITSQETTIIQHIFGGCLQSQVICAVCDKVSTRYENTMDLTVEIHGLATSLEECLDQFTAKEWLYGDNMYRCYRCNDHVAAWKRLSLQQAPNILTIALKRFQSGTFRKLDKRVSFPETLDLGPYVSEEDDGKDIYKLYGVVVHIGIGVFNASYFGHYICFTKDFRGNWYRIDDSQVAKVELDEVLSQQAYLLMYSRVHARPSSLGAHEPSTGRDVETAKRELIEKPLVMGSPDKDSQSWFHLCPTIAETFRKILSARTIYPWKMTRNL